MTLYRIYRAEQRYGGPEEGGWHYTVYVAVGEPGGARLVHQFPKWLAEPGAARNVNDYLLAQGTRDQLPDEYHRCPSYWDGDDTPDWPWPVHTWGDGSRADNRDEEPWHMDANQPDTTEPAQNGEGDK